METFTLNEDIQIMYMDASSFPEGILEAHQKLHSLIPFSNERRYFGLSRPEKDGTIRYKAAAEEMHSGEGEKLKCKTLVIKKGTYACIIVKDYVKYIHGIGLAFQRLITRPDIDPEGYCVEWYMNNTDVRCMVRLKSPR